MPSQAPLRLTALLLAASACVGLPPAPSGPDADADGVVDADDFCPQLPGTRAASGCADADAVADEQALRLMQAAEVERSRDALERRRSEAAADAEKQAEIVAWRAREDARLAAEAAVEHEREQSEVRRYEEEARRREATVAAEEESRARAAAERDRADAESIANAKSKKEKERLIAALEARHAREQAELEQAYAKSEEDRDAALEALRRAMASQQLTSSSGSDATCRGPLCGLKKPGPRLSCAPGDPLCSDLSPPPPSGEGTKGSEGYGYEFNDDPLAAGEFGPNDATIRVRPAPSVEGGTKSVVEFDDDTIVGDLSKPDGEYLEARRSGKAQGQSVTRYTYPTLEAPPFVKPKQAFDLRVTLADILRNNATRVDEGPTDAQGRLAMELPADVEKWSIDVELSAPGFQVLGDATGTLDLGREGDSTTVKFRLFPLELPKPAPERRVFVSLWFEGNFLARVSRTLTLRETAPTPVVAAPLPDTPARPGPGSTPPAAVAAVAPDALRGPVAPVAPVAEPATARMAAARPTDDSEPDGFSFDAETTKPAVPEPPAPAQDALRKTLGRKPGEPLLDLQRKAPDLTVHLVADDAAPGRWAVYVANAHGFVPSRTDVVSPADFHAWLAAEFQRFSGTLSRGARRRDTAAPAAAIAELKGFGRRLWATHVPRAVQNLFWILHDTLGAEFRSIQLYTNVPEFPWELARPWRRKADGSVEELDFLGIAYRVGRWHVGRDDAEQLTRPPQRQPLEAVTAVVPKYGGDEDLPAVQREVAAISHLSLATVVGGSRAELVKALDSAPRGIVHFAGHGVAIASESGDPGWAVKLEKDDLLQVREWRGLTALQSPPRLFFVNACELGRSARVAGLVDGWAPALLDTGASAYIGGLWPLGDTGASEFARRFYADVDAALEDGHVVWVADLLSHARRGLYENDDATFLGYVFYGDANLALVP